MLPDLRIRQRDYLLEIAHSITEELDLETVLGRIVRVSVEMLAGHAGLIALREEEGGWRIASDSGITPGFLKHLTPLLSDIPDHGDPARFALPEINRPLQRSPEPPWWGCLPVWAFLLSPRGGFAGMSSVFPPFRAPSR